MQAQRKIQTPEDALNDAIKAERVTPGQLTLNLIAGGLGTGIFSLPWSTAGASIVSAIFIIAAVLIVSYFTLMIIVRAGEQYQSFDFGSLIACLPGRMGQTMQLAVNVAIWVSTYFVLVGYFIVVADSAAPFVKGTIFDNRNVVVSLTAVAVLPLCFCNQRMLSWSSLLCIAVNAYILFYFLVLYRSQGSHSSGICYLGMSRGSIAMFSAMAQTIVLQVCVLPMYKQLEHRSPQKFSSILKTAFFWIFLLFASFSIVAYLVFGSNVRSNVLVDIPHTMGGNLGRIAAAITMFAVFPINLMPMMAPIQTYLKGPAQHEHLGLVSGRAQQNQFGIAIARISVITLVMLASYHVKDLGYMNVINGALSAGFFVAFCPALVGLYLLEKRTDLPWQVAMYSLLVVGLLMSALGLIFTDNYEGLMKGPSCMWSR